MERSLYLSFIYRLKLGFGRFFRRAYNRFWNVLLQKDTHVWANEVLIITELQASRTTGDALILACIYIQALVCSAYCGGALRERTLHSRRVLGLGVLLLLPGPRLVLDLLYS
jgi:hypothetical protein